MNVLLISQCDKRALVETRRILDQFAERRGDRTWQTAITKAGLDTLRKLLRKTARKNTAVACHWISGINHSELIWRVGDAKRFNAQGAVPTNISTRDILREREENDWHHADLLGLLTDLAGLLHDLGKAVQAFQDRLKNKVVGRNLIRHEWISLRLLESFVGKDSDPDWLARLDSPLAADSNFWLSRLYQDRPNQPNPSPFRSLAQAPLASALGWLVVTHHRLPILPSADTFQFGLIEAGLGQVTADWNEKEFKNATLGSLESYWTFPHRLPVSTPEWHQRAARIARKLRTYAGSEAALNIMNNAYVLHLARLGLMLADHHYSSLQVDRLGQQVPGRIKIAKPGVLAANTRRDKYGKTITNQTLDEHLVGVARHGAEVARFLPSFEQHLPRLARHRRLKQRSDNERFRWQDKAFELSCLVRTRYKDSGVFIINMASTGSGKTLANARIMYGLSDPALGMRCTFAMGLRTLTLQTGHAFGQLLNLGEDELAIRVGGAPNRILFEHFEQLAEATGSGSRQSLVDEDSHVVFEPDHDSHPLLRRAVADSDVRKLLLAPLLVCTIDHLTPATESQRGGRQIAPMLRLMSSDLVLDEPDDFDLSDLPALTRLVHWAGLLGSRVLLSSATLPPAIVEGLFGAYSVGRQQFQANRGKVRHSKDIKVPISCVWIDEFSQHDQQCTTKDEFANRHEEFVRSRAKDLEKQAVAPRRLIYLRPLEGLSSDRSKACIGFASAALHSALELHQSNHTLDPQTGKRVSFGLIRMANVEPLIQVAMAIFRQGVPGDVRVHLCVYHSRHPLLIRSALERQLDATLKRHTPNAVFEQPGIRSRLDGYAETNHLFVVLGSPVTEVGRDHDYDWAIVEPSSLRSLIQLLGRVRRHRSGECKGNNVYVFSRNLRSFTHPREAAFCKPGFEKNSDPFRLNSHDLNELIDRNVLATLDARPRIVCEVDQPLNPAHQLADLEHARLRDEMLPKAVSKSGRRANSRVMEANSSTWWSVEPQKALLTFLLQQAQPFRDNTNQREVSLLLLPDGEGDDYILNIVEPLKGTVSGQKLLTSAEHLHKRLPSGTLFSPSVSVWGTTDYMDELTSLASLMDRDLQWCAERFGTLNVPASDTGWISHPSLGFWKNVSC